MTAQINDRFRYHEKEYSLAGISEGALFDPSVIGLKPSTASTACWRGYQAVFALIDSRLVLDTLHVNLRGQGERERENRHEREVGPIINGVTPSPPKGRFDSFNNHYEKLNYSLQYSGGLLLADGFIQSLYVHMGFHPAWKYGTVIELVFEAGALKQEIDRSSLMVEIREMVSKSRSSESLNKVPSEDEIKQFVERAFDRRY